jgi:hypothetical protein
MICRACLVQIGPKDLMRIGQGLLVRASTI